MKSIASLLLLPTAFAGFDFGGDDSCSGSGSFNQFIVAKDVVSVGHIPAGLIGLKITLHSEQDIDIRLNSDETKVITWPDGFLNGPTEETKTWHEDEITYSGYNGDGSGEGNEYVTFSDDKASADAYELFAYGYGSGTATVDYSWTGRVGCNSGQATTGTGSFVQALAEGVEVVVGDLLAGLSDVYVSLQADADIDIVLYDGDKHIVHWEKGVIMEGIYDETEYAGVTIQYSGYNGEQRTDAYGKEYVFLSGTLSKTLTLKVFAYEPGHADVEYSWGYYHGTSGLVGDALKSKVHDIIKEQTQLTTSQVSAAVGRLDQDNDFSDHIIGVFSENKMSKAYEGSRWAVEQMWPGRRGGFYHTVGAGTDLHNAFPASMDVSQQRDFKEFGNGGDDLTGTAGLNCPSCKTTSTTFEPSHYGKGQAARALFYMATRYNGDASSGNIDLVLQDALVGAESLTGTIGGLATLKQWHAAYPPSDAEKNRNNLAYLIQGNRNPFIDNPEWVDALF